MEQTSTPTPTTTTTPPIKRHTLIVTDETGDTRMPFDPANDEELAAVNFQFDKYRLKGYMGFNSKTNTMVSKFDSSVEEITMISGIQGG